MKCQKVSVFNIQHYSLHDGPGIRTTIFLKGCPLRCRWCCNPESQEFAKDPDRIENIKTMSIDEMIREVEKDEVFYRYGGGGLTVSGGEPLAQGAFLVKLLKEAKKHYLSTAIETSGYGDRELLLEAAGYLDTVYYDVKCLNGQKHMEWTGVSNDIILENLKALVKGYGTQTNIIVRTPVIPGFNDDEQEIRQIKQYLTAIGQESYELLRYHKFGKGKYEQLGREYPMGDAALEDAKWNLLCQIVREDDAVEKEGV